MKEEVRWYCRLCAHSKGLQKPFVLAGIKQPCMNCNSFTGVGGYKGNKPYIPQDVIN